MKRKHLLFLASFVVLFACTVFLIPDQENIYQPRKSFASAESYNDAAEYYRMMRANPETGELDAQVYYTIEERARALNASKNGAALDLTWDEVGPDNIGGRTRAILIVSDDLMFAGGVSGGLFKSENSANTWERVPGFNINYSISTMAVLGNGHIYIGTGNTHETTAGAEGFGLSGGFGGGLFFSTDNGVTWKYAKDGDNDIKPSGVDPDVDYAYIDKIVADPSDDKKLWVGYNNALKPYNEDSGFGAVPNGLPATRCEDVDISAEGSVIVASVSDGLFGESKGYISNDGGANFTLISDDAVEGKLPGGLTRVEFAISQDDENYVYAAVVVDTVNEFGFDINKFDGVYSSIDKGNTWDQIWTVSPSVDPDPNGQARYDLAISVVPGNKESVRVGALTIWSAGNNEIPAQRSFAFQAFFLPGATPDPLGVHADVHVFEWADDGTLFIGTDGGIARSGDGGNSFIDANRYYNVTQFYAVGYSADDKVVGGSQDNGTQYITKDRTTPQESYKVGFGDGFDCEISGLDPDGNVMFTSTQFNTVFRSRNAGLQNFFVFDPINFVIGPFHSQIRFWETNSDFNNPNTVKFVNSTDDVLLKDDTIKYSSRSIDYPLFHTLEEDLAVDDSLFLIDPVSSLLAVGYGNVPFFNNTFFQNGVWVTRDALAFNVDVTWAQVVGTMSGFVTAQEWSKTDGDYLFVGTSTGRILRISGFADAYTIDEMSIDSIEYELVVDTIYTSPDGAPILDISIDPNNDDHLIAAKGGFGGNDLVIETNDATSAASFNNIWNDDDLAGLPGYTCLIDASDPNVILVGTEFGIYSTSDGGGSWGFEGGDPMGSFPIFDIRQQWRSPDLVENAGFVYVGSHGRGAFKSSSLQKNGIDDVPEPETNELVADLLIAPNPMSSYGRLQFNSDIEGVVNMDIYSIAGQKVKSLQFVMNLGSNFYQFDVNNLEHGTYIIQLNKDNKVTTKKFVIIR